MRIISYGFFFYAIGMVVETAFNGAGDTRTPTYINIFIFWLFEIPLAYVLAYWFNMGPHGVFWGDNDRVLRLGRSVGIDLQTWQMERYGD